MKNRVVITGMGVVSPIGIGIQDFTTALRKGKSGIAHHEILKEWGVGCELAGIPSLLPEEIQNFTKKYNLVKLRSSGILYGCMSAVEAWLDAGLVISDKRDPEPDWDSGCIFGTTCCGVDAFAYNVLLTQVGDVRKVGGRIAQQAMNSGVSAYIGGILGLGNQVTTNSSESNTSTEAIWEGYLRIRHGKAERMVVGGTESSSPYIFQAYDSGLNPDGVTYATIQEHGSYEDHPHDAYTPLSNMNEGVVFGSGSGALVLESLKSAEARGARIYGEIIGGASGSGGLRLDGEIKRTNTEAHKRCIRSAMEDAKITSSQITYLNGPFQNVDDLREAKGFTDVLNRKGMDFPYINSTVSLTGLCLSGGGGIEMVATMLQMHHSFLHPAKNVSPLSKNIANYIDKKKIPTKGIKDIDIPIAMKINAGLGDVYTCLIIKKWYGA